MRISDWSSDVCSSDLQIADSDEVSAKLFLLLNAADGTALQMSGRYDPGAKSLALTPSDWIYQQRGNAQAIGLTARLDDSGLRIAGALTDGPAGCSPFQAIQFPRHEPPPPEPGTPPTPH